MFHAEESRDWNKYQPLGEQGGHIDQFFLWAYDVYYT